MKKRLIAALVLVTLVIGLCSTIAAAAETPEYQVGYAKVDVNPYYSERFEKYLESKMPTYDGKWKQLKKTEYDKETGNIVEYGDIMPLSLQGNSHTQERLAIGKQDDNGDGIVDELDGMYVTCIAVTDPNGETVILLGTDMINGDENCVGAVRKVLYDKYQITGDRVMMDGSHNHHAPGYTGEASLKNSSNIDDNAAYWLQMAWGEYLREKLVEAADIAMADRQAAKLEKGTIEAEEANCASKPIGDTLNAIRKENKTNDPAKYADVEYVTVLEKDVPSLRTNWNEYLYYYSKTKDTNTNGEEYWTGSDGYKHVATPDLFPNRQYNAVRHYLQTSEQVLHTPLWANSGLFRAYQFHKYKAGDTISVGLKVGDYIPADNGTEITYVAGDNCNGVTAPGGGSAIETIWLTIGDGSVNYKESQIVPESEIHRRPVEQADIDNSNGRLTSENLGTEMPFQKKMVMREVTAEDIANPENNLTDADLGQVKPVTEKTHNRVYQFPNMYMTSSTEHVSEADDTMLVLKFDIIDADYQDILLINWRAHTNKSRTRSLDYKSEYTKIGFFDSFYQISSDWINAFRYTLEQAGYRVAYFSGASGNVNPASRLERFGGWQSWKETAGEIHVFQKKEVGTTVEVNTLNGKTSVEVTEDMVGYCYQTKWLGLDCNDSNIVTDASHAKNAGAIYGSELAEVALELLSGTNSTYKMQKITNPTGGIRSVQSLYQTDRKSISVEEFLAAGIYHREDLKDEITNNKSGTATYTVGYWVDENGEPIVDKGGVCSMLDENRNFVNKIDKDGKELGGTYGQADLDAYGYGQPAEWRTGKGTIASYLHANAAPRYYRSDTAGTQVELNAILLCDQIALITAPGELYDRYGYTDDPDGTKIYWTKEGPVNINSHNSWQDLWNPETYGEPFFLGYCNDSTGYMPSRVTYDYSDEVEGKAKGAYGVHTTSFAKGTGEDVILEFAWLLDQVTKGGIGNAMTNTRNAYCEHCKKEQTWVSLAEYIEKYVDAGHTTILNQGHYYVADNMTVKQLTVKNGSVCLDLNGKELLGEERAFSVAANGVLNIQDGSQEKTGTMAGQGFHAYSTGSGTTKDPFRGASGGTIYLSGELNLYSGTLTTKVANTYKPGNGGVVNATDTATFNMYGGAIANGVSGWAGGNIYGDIGSHLNLEGGSITGGTAFVGNTNCVMAKGTVCLQNDATVSLLQLWPENQSIESAYADMLTVKGKYTGTTKLSIKGADLAQAGLDIGTSVNAQYHLSNLTVKENSKLAPMVEGSDLVLRDIGNISERYCEYCKDTVQWKALSVHLASNDSLTTGHYYVDQADYVMPEQKITSGATVCLDLCGLTLKGEERAFEVRSGGVLNIQDSSTEKTGVLAGQGFEKATAGEGTDMARGGNGGTVTIDAGGILNLYSGTLTHSLKQGNVRAANGGVVCVTGTFNMYDGVVKDGDAAWIGGNICVQNSSTGRFNMYGGEVTGGSATQVTQTGCVVVRGTVALEKDAKIDTLTLWPGEAENAAPLGEMLTISGAYTGKVKLTFYNAGTVGEGTDIGTSHDAVLTGADITVRNKDLRIEAVGQDLVLKLPVVANVEKTDGSTVGSYTVAADAIENCDSPTEVDNYFVITQKIVLQNNIEELTVNKTVVLDLNGYDISTVDVAEGVTLYCVDSATDDFDISDNNYGKIGKTEGAGTVEGAPAGKCVNADGTESEVNGYLKITEADVISFHAVALNITHANLRPSLGGMYFTAAFNGDSLVKEKVQTYGIAMAVREIPTADNMGDTSKYTEMHNEGVYAFGGEDLNNVRNILTNIMRTNQNSLTNRRNAATKIYARGYIKTEDGYMFGCHKHISLQEFVERACVKYVDTDGKLTLTQEQAEPFIEFYNTFESAMKYWNIQPLKDAAAAAK